jgi:hypothetical protein
MTLKSAQLWCGTFVTKDADGLLSAATVGPVGALYVDGVVNAAAVTISGANPYKFSVTLPALTAGQTCSLYVTATVATVATGGVVAQDASDTKIVSGLNDIAAGALMGLANDAITLSKFDEVTAWPLVAADAGVTQVARVGADGDTLETLSDQIDTVHTDVDAILADTGTDGVVLKAAGLATDAVNEIADGIWDEALSGHTTSGTAGELLNHTATAGAGATTWTYTLTSTVGGTPIADADVWVTTDIAGTNVIASGKTNASGVVTFYLDSGTTVFVWRQRSGFDFVNPDSEVISA